MSANALVADIRLTIQCQKEQIVDPGKAIECPEEPFANSGRGKFTVHKCTLGCRAGTI